MERISASEEKLNKNLSYKSILYTTGDELVNIVFEILGKILNYDLSNFKDKKHEDFLIKQSDITFIGEIKGVNSSIKNQNISQLEVHYQTYKDELENENKVENIKALLIMNSNKDRKPEEREKIHENQIKLAEKYGSLIIFEAFENKELTTEKIKDIFINKIGLLNFEMDFKL